MNLIEFKNNYFAERSQFVTFDPQGNVLDSCQTFFDLKSKNLFQFFDFLEALKDEIPTVLDNNEPLIIPRIESSKKNAIFDFIFKVVEINNKKENVLIIQKEINNYQYLRKVQQERNEAILKLSKKQN